MLPEPSSAIPRGVSNWPSPEPLEPNFDWNTSPFAVDDELRLKLDIRIMNATDREIFRNFFKFFIIKSGQGDYLSCVI